MNKEKAKAAFEAQLGKLQAELDWHKKELARVDHELVDACDRANKLQADLKSVNFSYWKKCEELSQLQEQNSKLRIFVNSMTDNSNFMFTEKDAHIVLKLARQCLAEIEGE
jgi:septal ring factor EnvC (AmiA/AmiB activator)